MVLAVGGRDGDTKEAASVKVFPNGCVYETKLQLETDVEGISC